MELEAYNRDRGGAQHEKGDVEIEGLYYGCKRRKVVPSWMEADPSACPSTRLFACLPCIRLQHPTTRLDVGYDDIKNSRLFKPTFKKYLYTYTRSNFLRIDADEAAISIMLPVQQFKKGRPY